MTRRVKVIYWISTIWLALGMLSTGIVQALSVKEEVAFIIALGYPGYFLTLLGTWKILGVVALLIPRFVLLKEWAYAGFFFTTSGAIYSHVATGNTMAEIGPLLLLLVLTVVSWYFRPPDRKVLQAAAATRHLNIGNA